MNFNHTTVLLQESVDGLNPKPSSTILDLTVGGGGHSEAIAERITTGRLICFDADVTAISAARERLKRFSTLDVTFHNANFAALAGYIHFRVDGILMDLGVSSPQLDNAERGFSFHEDAPLDMRMNTADGITAYNVVNEYGADELIKILYEYGEEKYAKGIVRGIVSARETALVKTTGELAEIIRCNVPLSVRNAKNPCRKTFQALRIEVNDELGNLSKALNDGFALLNPSGRMAVITFHSLEDRLVKRKFAEFTAGCDCPRTLPQCVCGKVPKAVHVTRKPIVPSESEVNQNRRARSAKLRIVEKI